MVVEYGQSVHTQLEAAPERSGAAGDTTDMIRSMALSSAELWHDVLQRLAELQESQVILARAIADLGAMVQESLASPRAAAIATGALDELPAGSAPGVSAEPATDVRAPRPDLEHSTDDLGHDLGHDFSSPTGAPAEPDTADLEEVAPVGLVDVEESAADDLVDVGQSPDLHTGGSAEHDPQVSSRRRFHFRRRPRPAAEAVDAVAAEPADVEEGAAAEAGPTQGAGSIVDEDWPPLPPPPLDEAWEPVAEQAPLRTPPPFEAVTAPPPPLAAVATDALQPSIVPTTSAAAEPSLEPAMADTEVPAGPLAAPPAPYAVMEPPAPPAPYSVMEPPAPPAPYSVMEPPAPPAPYSVMEPAAPLEPYSVMEPPAPAPAAIVYVPARAETAAPAPPAEAVAPIVLDGATAPEVANAGIAGAEIGFPPLPPPPPAADAGSEPEMVAGAADEPVLAAAGAGPSRSSASLATEILASTPAAVPVEGGPDRPDVLMVSEDLTLVSKSRKRRIQFRLR